MTNAKLFYPAGSTPHDEPLVRSRGVITVSRKIDGRICLHLTTATGPDECYRIDLLLNREHARELCGSIGPGDGRSSSMDRDCCQTSLAMPCTIALTIDPPRAENRQAITCINSYYNKL